MSFELLKVDTATGARRGRLKTPHGTVETPVFMPCTCCSIDLQQLERHDFSSDA
ncbi:MAG TPA: hypothetical protein VN444_06105, partial [Verrucomicrobiae bacterium]|nr:hypothetical protein [Verrucomicrobiae bacterium]